MTVAPGSATKAREAARLELEQALDAARALELTPEHRDTFVARLRARPSITAGRRGSWLVVGWAAVASVACVVLALRLATPPTTTTSFAPAPATTPAVIALGCRVGAVPALGARYAVLRHTESETRLMVREGTLTVRLFEGRARHLLAVGTEELWAEATGTTYTVGVEGGRSFVAVHAGTVHLRGPGLALDLAAGQRWRAGAIATLADEPQAVRVLAS